MSETLSTNENHKEFSTVHLENLRETVREIVDSTEVIDIHTHLFAPQFGEMNLFGIDELLTYHYLIAELFRYSNTDSEQFWKLTKSEKAELVWKHLFIENTPLSEAATGIITVLSELGLDANTRNLEELREYFRAIDISNHIDEILKKSRVKRVVMTNDPFDAEEVEIWEKNLPKDERFSSALRMDRLLNDWENTSAKLNWQNDLSGNTINEIRTFFDGWIDQMKPLYMAVSLPDSFDYFADDSRNKLIREVVLPTAKQYNLPFASMVGVRRSVNPELRAAGDVVRRIDLL